MKRKKQEIDDAIQRGDIVYLQTLQLTNQILNKVSRSPLFCIRKVKINDFKIERLIVRRDSVNDENAPVIHFGFEIIKENVDKIIVKQRRRQLTADFMSGKPLTESIAKELSFIKGFRITVKMVDGKPQWRIVRRENNVDCFQKLDFENFIDKKFFIEAGKNNPLNIRIKKAAKMAK